MLDPCSKDKSLEGQKLHAMLIDSMVSGEVPVELPDLLYKDLDLMEQADGAAAKLEPYPSKKAPAGEISVSTGPQGLAAAASVHHAEGPGSTWEHLNSLTAAATALTSTLDWNDLFLSSYSSIHLLYCPLPQAGVPFILNDRPSKMLWGYFNVLQQLVPPAGSTLKRQKAPMAGLLKQRHEQQMQQLRRDGKLQRNISAASAAAAARAEAAAKHLAEFVWVSRILSGHGKRGNNEFSHPLSPLTRPGAYTKWLPPLVSPPVQVPPPPGGSWAEVIKQRKKSAYLRQLVKMTSAQNREFERNHAARVIQVGPSMMGCDGRA